MRFSTIEWNQGPSFGGLGSEIPGSVMGGCPSF